MGGGLANRAQAWWKERFFKDWAEACFDHYLSSLRASAEGHGCLLTVTGEVDGTNSQGASGHFSERTWKTVSTQEIETSLYSIVEDTLLSPKSPMARGRTLCSSHMVCYPAAVHQGTGLPSALLQPCAWRQSELHVGCHHLRKAVI